MDNESMSPGPRGYKCTPGQVERMRLARILPVRPRLYKHSIPEPNSGCWLWTGTTIKDGYGQISIHGRGQMAHRVSYETFVGPIPEGMTIDHLCRITCCINPDHLQPVTNTQNILRGVAPSARNAVKTHCLHGHPLSGANLYITRDGLHRRCRTCTNRRTRDFERKRRAEGRHRPTLAQLMELALATVHRN